MKPREIALAVPPLVGTFKHAESEHAASLIVLACKCDDAWKPVTWIEIEAVIVDEAQKGTEFSKLFANPFFRPDVHQLIEDGFARWIDDRGPVAGGAVEFTEAGLERLKRWRTR